MEWRGKKGGGNIGWGYRQFRQFRQNVEKKLFFACSACSACPLMIFQNHVIKLVHFNHIGVKTMNYRPYLNNDEFELLLELLQDNRTVLGRGLYIKLLKLDTVKSSNKDTGKQERAERPEKKERAFGVRAKTSRQARIEELFILVSNGEASPEDEAELNSLMNDEILGA